MDPSKVYFTDFRTKTFGDSIQNKLLRLITKAGMDQIDFNNKFVAIKIHFGEPGNLAFLRPNYARTVVDFIKERGGKPFLTDCNTLYVGGRKNALEHMEAAYMNGFSPFSTNCHLIIADGLKGTDDIEVPVNGEYVKNAKIGRAIMDADIIISLNHFKGHEQAGFGGALKNLGMGCGSRAGKMEMHSDEKPHVIPEKCIVCGMCSKACAHDAQTIVNGKTFINHSKCVGCGRCIGVCPTDAIAQGADTTAARLNCKIAEYAKAVIQNRPNFHINIVRDVSPNCDCHSENDANLIPNVGMFASFDPVALDVACADAVNQQPLLANTWLTDLPTCDHEDHFIGAHPETDWHSQVEHGEKIGIGQRNYELIFVK